MTRPLLLIIVTVTGFSLAAMADANEPVRWGNGLYVDLGVGETHEFLGKRIKLVSVTNNFCTVDVDAVTARLRVARLDRPSVINGVRIFADYLPASQLGDPDFRAK